MDRSTLLLSHALAEFATAHDHLRALAEVGVRIPQATLGMVLDDMFKIADVLYPNEALTAAEAVFRARATCAEYQQQLNELLNEQEGPTDGSSEAESRGSDVAGAT